VKYTLADGNYVVLNVDGAALGTIANLAASQPTPQNAKVFFLTSDCSGDAYVNLNAVGTGVMWNQFHRLTKRQAFTLGLPLSPVPPSNWCPNVPQPAGGNWLFATDALACPIPYQPNTPSITFQAAYGVPPYFQQCAPVSVTFGGNSFNYGTFLVFKRIEDLDAKFRPPFYIP
jgi:hypothetical protein